MRSQSNGSKVPSNNLLVTTRLFETFILSLLENHYSQRPTGADVSPETLRFLFSLKKKNFESLSLSLFPLILIWYFLFKNPPNYPLNFFKFQILNSFFYFINQSVSFSSRVCLFGDRIFQWLLHLQELEPITITS